MFKHSDILTRVHQPYHPFANHQYGSTRSARSLRKLVEILDQRHSSVSIIMLLLHTGMETLSVALYVWASEVSYAQTLRDFRWPVSAFIMEVILNIIFFIEWIALFFFEQDKRRYFVSWLTLNNALTSVPMIILGIGSLVSTTWRYGWVPMYLRVWWIYDCVSVLLDYPQLSWLMVDMYRRITRYFVRVFAVMCTCIGTVQIVQSCTGSYIDIYDTTYMMVVAFSTIGYGDVVVRSTAARLFMIVILIFGICYFLPLFQQLNVIRQKRWYYNTYRGWRLCWSSRRHVIICGVFSDLAVEVLLRNFYAGWRKYLDTDIVLMSTEKHSAEVALIVNLPWFRDRVRLMVGNPTKPNDLARADAKHAEAIFLFGNARSFAYYHDYTVIEQSMAVGSYDPMLPQHILLRRSRTTRDVIPYAASVLEIERTIHHLLGLSMVCPGAIPFIVNLLRTYEPLPLDITLKRNWVDEYEYSLRNDVYDIAIPDTLREKGFHELAKNFFAEHVTLIGVLNQQNRIQLNPRDDITDALKYLVIAKTRRAAEEVTERIARETEWVFGEEMLSVPVHGLYSGESSSSDNLPAAYRVSNTTTTTTTDTNDTDYKCNNNNNVNNNNDYYYYDRNNNSANGECNVFTMWQRNKHTKNNADNDNNNNNSSSSSSSSSSSYSYSESNNNNDNNKEKENKNSKENLIEEKDTNIVIGGVNDIERNTAKNTKHGNLFNKPHKKGYWRMEDKVEDMPWGMNQYRPVVPTVMMAPEPASRSELPRALIMIDDAYDFNNHFVILDLSSAKTKDKESRHSRDAARLSVANDMLHVMMPIRQTYPMSDIILLTNDLSFASYFEPLWNLSPNANPVKYIIGCGLNTADLRRCNLEECAGSCIFYAGDISAYGSTSAMSLLVVRSIHHILQHVPNFPVVVELEGLINLSMFPPYAEDDHLRTKAEVDFVFEPNFLIGNAISRSMLYPCLQRNFFLRELTDVLDVIISGHTPDLPALASMRLAECDVNFDIYEDVINYALRNGFLPVALHRRIDDIANPSIHGKYYVLTNPPHTLRVYQLTDAYFYITPGPLTRR